MKAPLVIGYRGEIGSFILRGLLRTMPKALNIWCHDINETENERIDRITKADVIFLCIPIDQTIAWFKRNNRFLKGKTVIEQCSLKEIIRNIDHREFKLLSMHILFRPSATPDRKDRNVLLVRHSDWDEELVKHIEDITESKMCWIEDIKEHDIAMAYEQALIHKILLTLGGVIEGKTYIGKKIKELTDRIRNGDPKLYKMIQDNKYLPKAINEFNRNFKNFDKITWE